MNADRGALAVSPGDKQVPAGPGVSLTRAGRRPLWPEVGFVLHGQPRHLDARDCGDIPFEACTPVRPFRSWKGKGSYSGHYWSHTDGRHVGFESLTERSALLMLDRDSSVLAISSQPMWISWPAGPGAHRHAPDFFARHANGDGEVIDVRPEALIDERAAAVFEATRSVCAEAGLRYRVISEFGDVRDRNLRFLHPYGAAAWSPPEEGVSLLQVLRWPVTVGELAAALGGLGGLSPIGWVYSMLWDGTVVADLDLPISTRAPLSLGRAGL